MLVTNDDDAIVDSDIFFKLGSSAEVKADLSPLFDLSNSTKRQKTI
jgi:hypothetical protein